MGFSNNRSRLRVTAACAGFLISLSACGSDSTGPSRLESSAALQSLALGMNSVLLLPSPIPPGMDASFDEFAPRLGQVTVTIGTESQSMFALGIRQTFPAGTCFEDLFIFPSIPPVNTTCTPPGPGLGLILWQSHSASAPPDRIIIVVGDIGTIDFSLFSGIASGTRPGVAMYLEGRDKFWVSQSGTLTSQVAATSVSCGIPLPPYAKSGSCNVATFDEQAAITFEGVSETGPTTPRLNVTIARQTLHGLWQTITETQPIALPEFQQNSPWKTR